VSARASSSVITSTARSPTSASVNGSAPNARHSEKNISSACGPPRHGVTGPSNASTSSHVLGWSANVAADTCAAASIGSAHVRPPRTYES
jgi:hypothetical protein